MVVGQATEQRGILDKFLELVQNGLFQGRCRHGGPGAAVPAHLLGPGANIITVALTPAGGMAGSHGACARRAAQQSLEQRADCPSEPRKVRYREAREGLDREARMWWTYGDPPFVLPPKHAAVFRIAAGCLSDDVGWEDCQDDDWYGIDVVVFDHLTQGQKQAAILEVCRALLDPAVEPPRVTAVLAGTVDAIYRELESYIECEINFAEETDLRRAVLVAMEEANYWEDINSGRDLGEDPYIPLAPECDDLSAWAELIESLRTDVLEDYDFDMEDKFLDMPPAEGAALKKAMNILPDYFTATVEDPTPAKLADIMGELRSLLR
jgi:hypothetical protein